VVTCLGDDVELFFNLFPRIFYTSGHEKQMKNKALKVVHRMLNGALCRF